MKRVSIILQSNRWSPALEQSLNGTLDSMTGQNYPDWEMIITCSPPEASCISPAIKDKRVRLISGSYKNRAQAVNRALKEATGDYCIIVDNEQVSFRLSTLETFVMTGERNPGAGMIYSDYRLMDGSGKERDVQLRNPDQERGRDIHMLNHHPGPGRDIHLLDHHPGRLRDNMDYGPMLFFPRKVLEDVGGLNEHYQAADLYDLRLRVSSKYPVIHINAARNGYAYIVKAEEKKHNVFDYLMDSGDVQKEMEQALTEHLKKIGAYLKPGMNTRKISYTPEEEEKFRTCIASIIIPVFNRAFFIARAIDSIQAQTVQNIEAIIVCNGGMEDHTIPAVEAYIPGGEKYDPLKPRVTLLVEDINNIGFCMNKGISQARGKYYIQLDSDDRLKPDAVEKIIHVFESDHRIGMVIGSYELWKMDDETRKITRMKELPAVTHAEWTEENGRNNLLRINGAGAPRAAHIRIIREIGGFGMNDREFCTNYGEDYDLVLRISEQHGIGRVWEPIYEVVRHSGGTDHSIDQTTIDRNDNAKDLMRFEAIERRKRINKM